MARSSLPFPRKSPLVTLCGAVLLPRNTDWGMVNKLSRVLSSSNSSAGRRRAGRTKDALLEARTSRHDHRFRPIDAPSLTRLPSVVATHREFRRLIPGKKGTKRSYQVHSSSRIIDIRVTPEILESFYALRTG